MHIVHYLCTARVVDGGVPKAAVDLSLRVGAAGHRVTFLTWDDELCPRSWKDGTDPNVRLVRLTPPERRLGFFSGRQLRAFADAIADADAVHLHAMWTPSNLQVARVARRLGKPYVITPHGMLDVWCMAQSTRNKKLFLLLGGNALLRHAAFVHFTAQSELDQARGLLPRGRTRVLPLVFDTEPYLKLPGRHLAAERFNLEEGGPIRLLFLSRIHPKKGLERLLGATRRLLESGQNVRLLVAGSGDPGYEAQSPCADRAARADRQGPLSGPGDGRGEGEPLPARGSVRAPDLAGELRIRLLRGARRGHADRHDARGRHMA
jgi:glycosyltransferase involved in cell wall biosynthesis